MFSLRPQSILDILYSVVDILNDTAPLLLTPVKRVKQDIHSLHLLKEHTKCLPVALNQQINHLLQ